MAQRIVTECDECAELGEVSDGELVEVSALGSVFVVDLCELHRKPLRELVDRLAELGRRPSDSPLTGVAVCPACGREFRSPQALGKHTKDEHGTSANALRKAKSDAHKCPVCQNPYGSAQGLAVHLRRTHGVQGTSKAARARASSASSPGGE